jgi:hypothetical protein
MEDCIRPATLTAKECSQKSFTFPNSFHQPAGNQNGISLSNLKKPLILIYPGRYQLMIRLKRASLRGQSQTDTRY